MDLLNVSDEREEGEIVDDFESISDYSISSPLYSGKSVSPEDLLKDVSLSSISDSGNEAFIYRSNKYTYENRKYVRKRKTRNHSSNRHTKRRRKSKDCVRQKVKYKSETSTEIEDERLDQHTLKKLKDAITINRSNEIRHNSLRTRLKAMIHLDKAQSQTEEEDLETLRTLALLSNTKVEETVDPNDKTDENNDKKENVQKNCNEEVNENVEEDNIDDELMQLRLEALKSAIITKANERKKLKEKQNIEKSNEEINKENVESKEVCKKSDVIDKHIITTNTDDFNKEKIKNKDSVLDYNKSVEEDVDIMRAMLLASMSKKITSNSAKLSQKNIFQRVAMNKNLNMPKHPTLNNVNNVNVFKKTKLPTVKPLIINLNNDSDSDTDIMDKSDKKSTNDKDLVNTVTQFLRQQRAAVEARHKSKTNVNRSSLDKSVVKLLPKSQQREYHLLKQKLLMAKRKRLRRISHKSLENKNTRKLIKKPENNTNIIKADVGTSKLSNLQRTLEDMQIQKNGRLQMKGKYKELAPLLRKVTEASLERKQCELEVEKLLEELKKARNKLSSSEQNFTNLVKRLTSEKTTIDQRQVNLVKPIPTMNKVKCTSTPIKTTAQEPICDISSINELSIPPLKSTNDPQVENCEILETSLNDMQVNTVDLKSSEDQIEVKKYISPLDNKNRDDVVNDPLTTFCPYELFGICKDPECTFNHCAKS